MNMASKTLLSILSLSSLSRAIHGQNALLDQCTNDATSSPLCDKVISATRSDPGPVFEYLRNGNINTANKILTNCWEIENFEETCFDGELPNWNEDPFGNEDWKLSFYSLKPIHHINSAYLNADSGQGLLKSFAFELVDSFNNNAVKFDPADYHRAAIRALILTEMYWIYKDTSVTQDQIDLIKNLSIESGNYLVQESNFRIDETTIGFHQAISLLVLALSFPEASGSATWDSVARQRLESLITSNVDADGVIITSSPSSHNRLLAFLAEIYLWDLGSSQASQRMLPSSFTDRIPLMIKFATDVAFPSGENNYPLIGKTTDGFPITSEEFSRLETTNPRLEWLRSSGQSGNPMVSDVSAMDGTFYPTSGLAMFRSSWEMRPDVSHVVVDAGPYRGSVSDLDFFHFTWYRNGLILRDSGFMTEQDGPDRNYFHGTSAHNVIRVDGKDQPENPVFTKPEIFVQDRWTGMIGQVTIDDWTWTRAFIMVGDNDVVIIDDIKGSSNHDFEMFWHFPASTSLRSYEHGFWVRNRQGEKVAKLYSFSTQPLTNTVVTGQTEPTMQGWQSVIEGVKEPASTLIQQASGTQSFRTVSLWTTSEKSRVNPLTNLAGGEENEFFVHLELDGLREVDVRFQRSSSSDPWSMSVAPIQDAGELEVNGYTITEFWENRACNQAGVVALTFDDGPTEWTNQALDAMEFIENKYKIRVPGTFFVNAERISGLEEDRREWEINRVALQRLLDTDQMLAHHTYTHAKLLDKSWEGRGYEDQELMWEKEFVAANDVFRPLIGRDLTPILRPPFHSMDGPLAEWFYYEKGIVVMMDNAYGKDAADELTNDEVYANMLGFLEYADPSRDSFVTLQHPHQRPDFTYELLRDFLEVAVAKGFRFVKADECLANVPTPSPTFRPSFSPSVAAPTSKNVIYNDHVFTETQSSQCTRPGLIALTFNEGPTKDSKYVLDAMKDASEEYGMEIKGSFFMQAWRFDEGRGRVRQTDNIRSLYRIVEEGHLLGHHTWQRAKLYDPYTFEDLGYSDLEQLYQEEFQRANDDMEDLLIHPFAPIFSPVYRKLDNEIADWLFDEKKIATIRPNAYSRDASSRYTDEYVKDYLLATLDDVNPETDSFIHLQHPERRGNVSYEILKAYIDKAVGLGFQFVDAAKCIENPEPYECKSTPSQGAKFYPDRAIIPAEFEIFLTLKMTGTVPQLSSIYHIGDEQNGPHIASLFVEAGSTWLTFKVAGIGGSDSICRPNRAVPLNEWIHVRLIVKEGQATVVFDQEIVCSTALSGGQALGSSASTFGGDFVYSGSPSAPSASACIEKLHIIALDGTSRIFPKTCKIVPVRGKQFGTENYVLGPEFTIDMDFRLNSVNEDWTSVFKVGEEKFPRVAAGFVRPGGSQLTFRIAQRNGGSDRTCEPDRSLVVGEWTSVKLVVAQDRATAYFDDVQVCQVDLPEGSLGSPDRQVGDPVYLASSFYPAADSCFDNFEIVVPPKQCFIVPEKGQLLDPTTRYRLGNGQPFSVILDFQLRGIASSWTSLFKLGESKYPRIVAAFVRPGGTQLTFRIAREVGSDKTCEPNTPLTLNAWTKIELQVTDSEVIALYDDVEVCRTSLSGSALGGVDSENGDPLYVGSPFYPGADGCIDSIAIVEPPVCEIPPTQGNIYGSRYFLPAEFEISSSVTIDSTNPSWTSIYKLGEEKFPRIAAAFVRPDSFQVTYRIAGLTSDKICEPNAPVPAGIPFTSVLRVESGQVSVFHDDVLVCTASLGGGAAIGNLDTTQGDPLYIGSPFFPPIAGCVHSISVGPYPKGLLAKPADDIGSLSDGSSSSSSSIPLAVGLSTLFVFILIGLALFVKHKKDQGSGFVGSLKDLPSGYKAKAKNPVHDSTLSSSPSSSSYPTELSSLNPLHIAIDK